MLSTGGSNFTAKYPLRFSVGLGDCLCGTFKIITVKMPAFLKNHYEFRSDGVE